MRLGKEQSQRLLRERGFWVTKACDKCGQLLGAVRWTRQGESGEWCSKSCREGVKGGVVLKSNSKVCWECGVTLAGKRADAYFCGRTHMMRYRRRGLSRTTQKREIIGNTPIEKQGLTEARSSGSTNTLTRSNDVLETLPNRFALSRSKQAPVEGVNP
jgi:hypothetical protein